MKEAMKSKDSFKLSVIRFLLAQIKNKEIELRSEDRSLEESDAVSVLKKQIKQRNQSIELYSKGNRHDLVEKEKLELEVLNAYYEKFAPAVE
ncbi:GatB/YqeY domain-containing protein [Candidatus Nomurabacteria bacterium]|uniref:GatB/YqeY domain-containing protein n=1 Tax=candidate division WWE3 bacterium TaxID=2053526 RepID=A0A955DZD6_UNCKA|nr:GatB/YqeY domain-containing protein [candidate division WWE3 bacterium]MCB9827260.1 GatB/YqeY domain-containing protein [Candidatus Nomurabacteria bacterium]